MRILFIGGTRSVGVAAALRLAGGGHEIGVFHRGAHEGNLPPAVVHFRSAAAEMPVRSIPDELRAFEPEVVVHMIAMGEEDALAAVRAFGGIARRVVAASSGDVYRAFAIFTRREEGPPEKLPLTETAALRTDLYPYRTADTPPGSMLHDYDKILMERAIASDSSLPATILRFPKIFGPADNADLATVYGFRHRPHWRWTHGHAVNVGAAIALATLDDRAAGRTYNVGELRTPTMSERLAGLPADTKVPPSDQQFDFSQDMVCDTGRIRSELGYREEVDEARAMRDLAEAATRIA